jgi:hypothetical protein
VRYVRDCRALPRGSGCEERGSWIQRPRMLWRTFRGADDVAPGAIAERGRPAGGRSRAEPIWRRQPQSAGTSPALAPNRVIGVRSGAPAWLAVPASLGRAAGSAVQDGKGLPAQRLEPLPDRTATGKASFGEAMAVVDACNRRAHMKWSGLPRFEPLGTPRTHPDSSGGRRAHPMAPDGGILETLARAVGCGRSVVAAGGEPRPPSLWGAPGGPPAGGAAPVAVMVSYFLAKNTSGSLRPCGNRKSVTWLRLSPQAK